MMTGPVATPAVTSADGPVTGATRDAAEPVSAGISASAAGPASDEVTPHARRRGRWAQAGPALAGGLGFSLIAAASFPQGGRQVGVWWGALFALAPLLVGVERAARRRAGGEPGAVPWRIGAMAGLGGVPFWALCVVWAARQTQLGYVPFVLTLAAFVAAFAWVAAAVLRRWRCAAWVVLAPVLWAGLEVARGAWAFEGFPWYLLAHPLIDGPAGVFTWPASWAGAYAVSALACLPAAAIADALARRWRAAAAGAAVTAAWVGVGMLGPGTSGDAPDGPSERMTIAAVQTNVPQSVRGEWGFDDRVRAWRELLGLMSIAALSKPDLIALPEGMYPGNSPQADVAEQEAMMRVYWPVIDERTGGETHFPLARMADELASWQRVAGVPVLVGAKGYDDLELVRSDDGLVSYESDASFNSVYLVEGGRVDERYDKLRLTPFGEVMPYISWSDGLERAMLGLGAAGMRFDLSAGREARVLLPAVPRLGRRVGVATPVCYEATVPWVCRSLVFGADGERRAAVLINATNDGWFGDWTAGRAAHMLAARWRCVELATPMVRSANTGISSVIDRRGVVTHRGPTVGPDGRDLPTGAGPDRVAGVAVGEVELGRGVTAYAAWGHWLTWAWPLGAAVVGATGLWPIPRGRVKAGGIG